MSTDKESTIHIIFKQTNRRRKPKKVSFTGTEEQLAEHLRASHTTRQLHAVGHVDEEGNLHINGDADLKELVRRELQSSAA